MVYITYVCDHWDAKKEHHHTNDKREGISVGAQMLGPVVQQSRDEGFHQAEFTVDS